MDPILVLPQCSTRVESCIADCLSRRVDKGAREWSKFEMISTDMSLKSLVFSECLVARGVCCASESVMAFMRFLMSS